MKLTYLSVLTLAIASATGGLLIACSTSSENQSQAPSATPTETGSMEGIDHGSMNHSMAMDLGPADANYDLRFIDAMTPHHQGAVEMAKEAQQKSQRPEIKQLANDIIKAQTTEIEQLKQWRKAWYPQAGKEPVSYGGEDKSTVAMSDQQDQAMRMMSKDLGAADAEFDLRFINAMIPHHEGAVTMAQDALNKSKRPEMKQLAQDIVRSQQVEIEQMNQWRQAWYKK